jgi:hypothetical protein
VAKRGLTKVTHAAREDVEKLAKESVVLEVVVRERRNSSRSSLALARRGPRREVGAIIVRGGGGRGGRSRRGTSMLSCGLHCKVL